MGLLFHTQQYQQSPGQHNFLGMDCLARKMPGFEWHGWSNVACVAVDEIDLLWSMEEMFLKAQLDQIRLDPTSFDMPSSCPTQFLCWNRFEIYLIRLLHLHNNVRGFSEDVLLDEAGLH